MEAKHTPGPWIADNNEGFSPWSIWSRMTPTGHGTPGPMVASVHGDSAESDANAQLIAAAPDLLEALRQAFDMLREQELKDVFGYEWHGIARAAIAKATGAAP